MIFRKTSDYDVDVGCSWKVYVLSKCSTTCNSLVYVYVYLTDLLTVHYHTHDGTSKLTATISWIYRNYRMRVDSWKLRVRNLTWEQNDYDYPEKHFKCNGGAIT